MFKKILAGLVLVDRAIVAVGGPSMINLLRRYTPRHIPVLGAALGWGLSKLGSGPSLPRIAGGVWSRVR
ncbi:MAG TPA: hypothetical protein VHP83_24500 [Aggregatilineaceae bacterium]|nr:hypothetical protein [Aggregatilineaceae bacterium]